MGQKRTFVAARALLFRELKRRRSIRERSAAI
jgi:hypothetical protein